MAHPHRALTSSGTNHSLVVGLSVGLAVLVVVLVVGAVWGIRRHRYRIAQLSADETQSDALWSTYQEAYKPPAPPEELATWKEPPPAVELPVGASMGKSELAS